MAKKIPIKSLKRGSVRYFLILTRDFGRARQSLREHFTLPAQKIRLRLADAREMSTVGRFKKMGKVKKTKLK